MTCAKTVFLASVILGSVVANCAAQEPSPGNTITNSIGMKLTLIPAGEFMMGRDETAQQLRQAGFTVAEGVDTSNEGPRHRVRITKPFLMGTYAVTVGQFRQFVTDTGYVTEPEKDGQGSWGYNADMKTMAGHKPEFTWRIPVGRRATNIQWSTLPGTTLRPAVSG